MRNIKTKFFEFMAHDRSSAKRCSISTNPSTDMISNSVSAKSIKACSRNAEPTDNRSQGSHPTLWRRLICGVFFSLAASIASQAHAIPQMIVDVETNRIIAEQDIDTLWHPASLTKLMTAYLAFQAMQSGRLTPQSIVAISPNAASKPPSKLGLAQGFGLTLDDALTITLTRSMNDVAAAIGETVAQGSESQFADMMNAQAARLGMNSTHFANATGLDNESQVTTARDMAILAIAITRDFPQFKKYFGVKQVEDGKKVYRNTNGLVRNRNDVDGMKTGFLCSSGFNLINRVTINGKRYISVVLGAPSTREREKLTLNLIKMAIATADEGPALQPAAKVSGQAVDLSRYGCGKTYTRRNQKIFRAAASKENQKHSDDAYVYRFLGQ